MCAIPHTLPSHLLSLPNRYWNPGHLRQAEDRAHRIGQTKEVTIHYLLGRGGLDQALWPLLGTKVGVVASAIDGVRTHSGQPSAGGQALGSAVADHQGQTDGEAEQADGQLGQSTLPEGQADVNSPLAPGGTACVGAKVT